MAKNKAKNGPWMIDTALLIQAGIDPKTLLPIRMSSASPKLGDMRRMMRIIDEQNAVNRFTWYNLPGGITGQELERMLYYKGQVCLFYFKGRDKFYFMPFALDGTIDFYGRFNSVHPIPWQNTDPGADDPSDKKKKDPDARYVAQEKLLSAIKLDCVYDVQEEMEKDLGRHCVILHDYTKQLSSQNITPRYLIQESIISMEAEVLPLARTALIAATGTRGVRVTNTEESAGITAAAKQVYQAAMNGDLYIPINGSVDFQDLANHPTSKAEEYLETMQAIDNFRVSAYGIDNGGLFQKKAHVLEDEHQGNQAPVGTVAMDGLAIRQNFCIVANSLWGLGIWCERSQASSGGADMTPEESGEGGDRNEAQPEEAEQ